MLRRKRGHTSVKGWGPAFSGGILVFVSPRRMTAPAESARSVSLRELANVYFWIGISSFGGGLISWVHRETVERRKWLRDQEFLSGLAPSQILPGPTMVNMTIYLGIQLRGAASALASWSSLVLPPSRAMLAIYYLYLQFHEADVVHFALSGVAATAAGLNIATRINVAPPSTHAN